MRHNFVHINFLIILQDKQLYAYTCNTLQKGRSSRRNVSLDDSRAAQCVIVKRRGQKVNKHFRLGASIQKEFDN